MSNQRKLRRKVKNVSKNGSRNQKVIINFKNPNLISKEIIDGRLKLELQWDYNEYGTSIISRNQGGYNYMDVGHHNRYFSNSDSLIWEYNLPVSKSELEDLPISGEMKSQLKFTEYGKNDLNNSILKWFK